VAIGNLAPFFLTLLRQLAAGGRCNIRGTGDQQS